MHCESRESHTFDRDIFHFVDIVFWQMLIYFLFRKESKTQSGWGLCLKLWNNPHTNSYRMTSLNDGPRRCHSTAWKTGEGKDGGHFWDNWWLRIKIAFGREAQGQRKLPCTDLQTGSVCVIYQATQSTRTRPQLPALEKLTTDHLYITYHSHGYFALMSRTGWISQEWCAPPIKREN